jgi:hypothetical protein
VPRARATRGQRLGVAGLVAAIAFASAVRIDGAFSDPAFDRSNPDRLLKSDPALLYYFVERILESGGLAPPDFRADPRVAHPDATDLPALFPIQQEFAIAWLYRAFGGGLPLHVFCVVVMGIFASLTCVGVFGLARELTGSRAWAALALALHALSPAAYRTLGFILMNEDWSLPWFALHLWLLARAARLRTPGSFVLAALAAGLALSSWHAMSFVVALEAACVFACFVRTGENPLRAKHAWLVPGVLFAFGASVPVLRQTVFALSLPMQLAIGLLVAAGVARVRPGSRTLRVSAGIVGFGLAFAAALGLARAGVGGMADYSHVFELAAAKLAYLGQLPEDPGRLSFEARLLWQGPFETASVRELFSGCVVGTVLVCVAACQALPDFARGRGEARWHALVLFALGSALAAWGVRRLLVVPALVAPVVAVTLLARLRVLSRGAWIAGLALAQALLFAGVMSQRQSLWYFPLQQAELANVVHHVRLHLPREGAVAADFVTSSAVLAGTGHPIVLQPKYESRRTRARIEAFLHAFFLGSPADFRAVLDRYEARYLLIDRQTLWLFRYVAGLPLATPRPLAGSPAEAFLSDDPRVFGEIPGYRLIYRSTLASDMMRLYELL